MLLIAVVTQRAEPKEQATLRVFPETLDTVRSEHLDHSYGLSRTKTAFYNEMEDSNGNTPVG